MSPREVGALFLVLLMGCSGTPRVVHRELGVEPEEAESAAAGYEEHELSADMGRAEPVVVPKEEFQRAMRMVAPELHLTSEPRELARWLMEGELRAELRAEIERGRVVRLLPLEEGGPLEAASVAEIARGYGGMCQEEYGGGDCLGLFTDGPVLTREDLRTLGLALSLRQVLKETRMALRQLVSPAALVSMVVWTGCFYLLLWLLPEPVSKALAASLTVALLAWLPVQALWSLMDGWALLVREVDRATSYGQIEQASERFRRVMGENTARVVVMLVTAVLTGGAVRFAAKLPRLPGFERAAAWAEAQGLRLTAVGEVEAVGVAEERTFTLMVRRPGSTAAVAEEARAVRAGVTTIIRHRGGNRQVFLDNGQRWHLRAGQSSREIPLKDPVGDRLVEAGRRIARDWGPDKFSREQSAAIDKARAQGRFLEAHLMERRFRGQWVERMLSREFTHLRWNGRGVDAVDPATGIRYEVLSGTHSNMELHGRRMADIFFRMIAF
ncbi:SitA5 family polymorphic toxin [Hyalangium gracile]|uniref:SitA5 family polymorphic toxin n=1 Tax=Hyalangium gracile TaxID=394092 RepID=UPI001CCE628C|nr:hypothetical protein [Hyalangium gracile]